MNEPIKTSFRTKHGFVLFESKGKQERFKSCERKEPLTNAEAMRHIQKSAKRGILLHSYLCHHCRNWHVTHNKSC